MINSSQTNLNSISVHGIGNRINQGQLKLSEKPLAVSGGLLNSLLLTYFLSSFRTPEYYSFADDDAGTFHVVKNIVASIFSDPSSLHASAIELAERLYAVTKHPNIKPGELYVARFTNVDIEGRLVDAVGIFKSETKEKFLKINEIKKGYMLSADEGINVTKLDKGCLVLNEPEGYKVLLADLSNREEATFWKEDFLGLQPLQDAFHHTHNFMNLTRQYVGDQLDEEFSVSKADKIDLLNRSMKFFKSHDQFNQNEFESEVLGDSSVIESFRKYERTFMDEGDVAKNFEISAQAVRRQARVFKSVLKLDKNFHIYIHGNRELIEKGYDNVLKRHFYKIYFDQES